MSLCLGTTNFITFRYYRCEFKIPVVIDKSSLADGTTTRSCKTHSFSIEYDTKVSQFKCNIFAVYIHYIICMCLMVAAWFVCQWDSIQSYLLTAEKKPVVLKRAASTNTTNPFGSTFCYGVHDMIFEVIVVCPSVSNLCWCSRSFAQSMH